MWLIIFTGMFVLSRAFVSPKSRNAVFALYHGLTIKTDMPLRYCVFINNISIFYSLPIVTCFKFSSFVNEESV